MEKQPCQQTHYQRRRYATDGTQAQFAEQAAPEVGAMCRTKLPACHAERLRTHAATCKQQHGDKTNHSIERYRRAQPGHETRCLDMLRIDCKCVTKHLVQHQGEDET